MSIILNIMKDANRVGITVLPYRHEETNEILVGLTNSNGSQLFIGYRSNPSWFETRITMQLGVPGYEPVDDIRLDDLLVVDEVRDLTIFALGYDMEDVLNLFIEAGH